MEFDDLNTEHQAFTLDGLVNQFLWNYVQDEDFDDAKEELRGIADIIKHHPEEEF